MSAPSVDVLAVLDMPMHELTPGMLERARWAVVDLVAANARLQRELAQANQLLTEIRERTK